MTRMLGGVVPVLVLGFAYRGVGGAPDDTGIIRIEAGHTTVIDPGHPDTGVNQGTVIWLEQKSDLTIRVWMGDGTPCGTPGFPGILLATLNTSFTRNVWRYIELVCSATGWAVYVDDVLDTQQTVTMPIGTGMDRYSFQKFASEDFQLDDHYAADTRLGPCRVTGLPPAYGSTHQWSPLSGTNLSQVSEFGNRVSSTPDDDVTFVSSSSAGDQDLFGWRTPACYGRILALAVDVSGRALSGSPAVNPLFRVAGNTYALGFGAVYGASYAIQQAISPLNPATNATWTDEAIGGGLFGYQMAGSGTGRVTQVFIEKLVTLRNVSFDCGGESYSLTQP